MEEIYFRLLNEGVDVWRPAQATRVGVDVFRIEGPAPPQGEEWEFSVGALVKARRHKFNGGVVGLVADLRVKL